MVARDGNPAAFMVLMDRASVVLVPAVSTLVMARGRSESRRGDDCKAKQDSQEAAHDNSNHG